MPSQASQPCPPQTSTTWSTIRLDWSTRTSDSLPSIRTFWFSGASHDELVFRRSSDPAGRCWGRALCLRANLRFRETQAPTGDISRALSSRDIRPRGRALARHHELCSENSRYPCRITGFGNVSRVSALARSVALMLAAADQSWGLSGEARTSVEGQIEKPTGIAKII
jgi:hypothetical protein